MFLIGKSPEISVDIYMLVCIYGVSDRKDSYAMLQRVRDGVDRGTSKRGIMQRKGCYGSL